tara:strand:- start:1130 stop:1408 length:279 start_codon:yes stop_codon:yes gene_type:complete
MHKFLFEAVLLAIIVSSCHYERERMNQVHLHNFPHLDDCPSVEARSIDDKEKLKTEAKALNMRYVDYLHMLSNSKENPKPKFPSKELWTNND